MKFFAIGIIFLGLVVLLFFIFSFDQFTQLIATDAIGGIIIPQKKENPATRVLTPVKNSPAPKIPSTTAPVPPGFQGPSAPPFVHGPSAPPPN